MRMASKRIRVTLRKSPIGRKPNQVKTVRALGLKRIDSSVEHEMSPPILGMIKTVSHLVDVEEIE
jgi:large subunit ribosomal protein L30